MHKDPRPHSVVDKLFTHIHLFPLQFICMAGWIISPNNKIWLSTAECPINFGDFLGVFWVFCFLGCFKLLKTRKDVSLPDNVNVKMSWLNTEVRGKGMAQTATFLLPCPQKGSGLFHCSDKCCRVQGPLSPLQHGQEDFSQNPLLRVERGCRITFLKDGDAWY